MLNYRKFNKESDYDIMRCIVQQNCTQTGHLYPQLHIGNLDFERYAFEENPDILYRITWFVYDAGHEIGFVLAYEDEFFITVLSGYENFIEDMLEFIERNCYAKGTHITTDANSRDTNLCRALEQHGYTKTGKYRFSGICDLSKISPCLPLPEGFIIRSTQKNDAARRVEIFDLATGGSGTTVERYKKMMESPSYKDAMDLVVVTDTNEIIAYCTVWNDPASKTAILEPVACVEEYRRRGIMKNTLLYGMNKLREQGTRYIYVGTGGGNIASQALYRSVGFVEFGKNNEWEKTL